MEELVDLLQEFVFNLMVIALPIISAFLIAALRALIKKWLAELEATKPQFAFFLREAVEIAVAAAEQMEIAGFVEDKKQHALNIAQAYLNEHGWDEFDIDVLEAAIEAEVLKQFGKE